jgi:hypothetical protein
MGVLRSQMGDPKGDPGFYAASDGSTVSPNCGKSTSTRPAHNDGRIDT